MARLPEPGGDVGQWGDVLNEYLEVSHTANGTLKDNIVASANLQNNSVTVAKIATTTAPSDGQTLTYTNNSLAWATSSGSGTVPDASTSTKGLVQLAGDLSGTAASPTVPGLATKEPTITAGTTSQYYRGDKTWRTLDKAAVGLSNVENTSDAAKPISTAVQTALDAKANSNDTRFTDSRTPTDNSVSTSKVQDGAITEPKLAVSNTPANGNVLAWDGADLKWEAPAAAPVSSVSGRTGAVTLTKEDVGLANVANTSDADKPVSTATQTALNGKANTSHTHAASDIASGTIATARLPQATEAAIGAVQLASLAEATTGTDTAKAVTSAGVAAAINAAANPVLFVDTLGDLPPGTPVDTLVIVRAA